MKKADLQRAARLARALADWDDISKALRKTRGRRGEDIGLEMSAGEIESSGGGELVQANAGAVLDKTTGLLIAAAAKRIIQDELKKLGVK